jgi:hypothetical protein
VTGKPAGARPNREGKPLDVIEPIDLADVYPDDWRELGWCCRECGILAWYSMSPELRRELHPARSKPS